MDHLIDTEVIHIINSKKRTRPYMIVTGNFKYGYGALTTSKVFKMSASWCITKAVVFDTGHTKIVGADSIWRICSEGFMSLEL
jgi:hypothetical protein